MGTSNVAIFADAAAADVRGRYRDLIGDGLTGQAATDTLLQEWRAAVDDVDDGPVFWLALAATQWACGRLEDRVRDRALAVIADTSHLGRWEKSGVRAKREAVLARLHTQLRAPQPTTERIPKRHRQETSLTVGDVFLYTPADGPSVLLRVVALRTDAGGTGPVVELLDWVEGRSLPQDLARCPAVVRRPATGQAARPVTFIVYARPRKYPFPDGRIEQLANVRLSPHPGGGVVTWWGEPLDREIAKALNPPVWARA